MTASSALIIVVSNLGAASSELDVVDPELGPCVPDLGTGAPDVMSLLIHSCNLLRTAIMNDW